ncbi:MAG: hypothetical protein Q9178_006322 [Gyalolechia marmorata]
MISAALVAGVAATHNATEPSYTTKVVTALTTFCPGPTQITHDGMVITVTSVSTSRDNQASTAAPEVPETHPAPVETHPAPVETHPAPVQETHPAPVPETHPVPGTTAGPVAPSVPVQSPAVPVPTGSSGPVAPIVSPPIYGNSTVPAGPTAPIGTAAPSGSGSAASPVAPFEGAAPKMAASGASLVGLLGLAAFFL